MKDLAALKKEKIISLCFALLFCIWTIVIFSNSMKNGEQSSQMSDGPVRGLLSVAEKLNLPFSNGQITVFVRKSAHIAEFFLLGGLAALCACFFRKRHSISAPALLSLLAALIDELIQFYVPGRSSEVRDVLIDFGGIAVGVIVVNLIMKKKLRNEICKEF